MLFGKKKKVISEIPEDILEFLEEADKRYIRAFETRSIQPLKDYFSRKCMVKLSSMIANQASSRYFGSDKFRTTSWVVIQKPESIGVFKKVVEYESIKVHGSMGMKISADYDEEWTIIITDDELIVDDIRVIT